jgi:hypothetical protein
MGYGRSTRVVEAVENVEIVEIVRFRGQKSEVGGRRSEDG